MNIDFCITTEYNPFDGFNHLTLKFCGLDEDYSKREFIEETIKCINKSWKFIKHYQERGKLPRKKRKRNISYSNKFKWEIFKRDNFACRNCGRQEDLELDHIIPISKGGKEEKSNYQTLCKKCNVRKKDKLDA